MKGRVLIIAGSDPSGGAGIQADIKTVTALGGYAATAITALTVQNTMGVTAVHPVAPEIIAAQIEAVMSDIGADAIKIGMIGDKAAAYEIAGIVYDLRWKAGIPVVLDPVLGATSGHALAGEGVAGVLYHELLPNASIATPNADELSHFTGGMDTSTTDALFAAGRKLHEWCHKPLLLKGGHVASDDVVDILYGSGTTKIFKNPRIKTTSTHGTGCTLASAIATGLAQGMALPAAVKRAITYVHKAIATAPGYGAGNGPLNHGHVLDG